MRFVHPSHIKIVDRLSGGQRVMYTDADGSQVCVDIPRGAKVERVRETEEEKAPASVVPEASKGEPGTGLH